MSQPLGIDLGTTYSVIAHRDEAGRPTTIQNAEGESTTPSAVYFHASGTVVGKEALKVSTFEPDRVALHAKRDMGHSDFHQPILGQRLAPELIQAIILRKLVDDAVVRLGEVGPVVVTVPAYFNEPRRRATMDAGRLAGLERVEIINEPTAAAIAFGVRNGTASGGGTASESGTGSGGTGDRERVLVYDLGGGTFDATLMEVEGLEYRTIATAGDVHLGGIDWNRRLIDRMAGEFQIRHGFDLRSDPMGMAQLAAEAEDAKRALTVRDDVAIHLTFDGYRLRTTVTRAEFELDTEDLVQRTVFTVNRLLKEAGLKETDLTRLLLVGGSTRMPMIQRALEQSTGMVLDRSLSPDEAVAHGAALYAGMLAGADRAELPRLHVTNVNSHDLGVVGTEAATGRSRRQILIPRNTALPAQGIGKFVTGRRDQSSVAVKVVEGGDASGKHATPIGKCVVRDLPPGLPARAPVEVKFRYTRSGRLTVTAWLPTIQQQAQMTVERAAGMSDVLLRHWQERLARGCVLDEDVLVAPDEEAVPAGRTSDGDSQGGFDGESDRSTTGDDGDRVPGDGWLNEDQGVDSRWESGRNESPTEEPIGPSTVQAGGRTTDDGDLFDLVADPEAVEGLLDGSVEESADGPADGAADGSTGADSEDSVPVIPWIVERTESDGEEDPADGTPRPPPVSGKNTGRDDDALDDFFKGLSR